MRISKIWPLGNRNTHRTRTGPRPIYRSLVVLILFKIGWISGASLSLREPCARRDFSCVSARISGNIAFMNEG